MENDALSARPPIDVSWFDIRDEINGSLFQPSGMERSSILN